MRVAFVFPSFWPYVRRGAERLTAEYAEYLVGAGHTVDIITSKPGSRRVVQRDGLTIYYEPRLSHPVLTSKWPLLRFYTFALSALPHLSRRRYDVVHIWLYTYGPLVRLARMFGGAPYLYHSMVEPPVLPGPVARWAFGQTVPGADQVAALTAASADRLRELAGVPVRVLPACVDLAQFAPGPKRSNQPPRVLFTSDLHDYRKGATLLLRAWDEIHRGCPDAILSFAGPFGQSGIPGFDPFRLLDALVHDPAARARIELVGEGRVEDVPRRYAEAAVTVLPAVDEAFGLVLIESLACGTPVVANSEGGPGEIVSDPAIGATVRIADRAAMSEPGCAVALAEAVLKGIALSRTPETADRCRAHATAWSRERVGPLVEATYREMVAAA